MSEARTEILWDHYGVPHIFAPDHTSLFSAYGYAQMEAHAELLIRLYAQARGCAALHYGDAYLEDDQWVHTMGIPTLSLAWTRKQSRAFAPLLRAFAAGLNHWAGEHAAELSAAARSVLPLTVADVLAHGMRVINFEWQARRDKIAGRLAGLFAPPEGSNGWAIGPSRTASGNAMLLSNSHLPWADRDTYFEVQLTAPGVTSYGAVWVGFPVLRQCFTTCLGWTQTTNNPSISTLYRLDTDGTDGYRLDGETRPFDVEEHTIGVRRKDGTVDHLPHRIRRAAHGPVVVDCEDVVVALRVAGLDRPRMYEQFWRMGLATNLEQFHAAMRMQQLPLFNTMYADRDGHIMYVYNAASPRRESGDHQYWQGPVPGDRSELIWDDAIVPYDELPKVIDPPDGWVQNCNDTPWTCTHPMILDPAAYPSYLAPPPAFTPRAQRSVRLLATAGPLTLDELEAMKMSTHVETADHFVDDLVAAARATGGDSTLRAAEVLASWDRLTECDSVGPLLFYRFLLEAGDSFTAAGGYAVGPDPQQPLSTPRGFADPDRAATLLGNVAARIEAEYGRLEVPWGDVLRFRRGSSDFPANGASSEMGAIRTAAPGPFDSSTAAVTSGDTFYAVVEFSDPVQGRALLPYGNWSREDSPHVEDQLPLAAAKQMRPILLRKPDIEAELEQRTLL